MSEEIWYRGGIEGTLDQLELEIVHFDAMKETFASTAFMTTLLTSTEEFLALICQEVSEQVSLTPWTTFVENSRSKRRAAEIYLRDIVRVGRGIDDLWKRLGDLAAARNALVHIDERGGRLRRRLLTAQGLTRDEMEALEHYRLDEVLDGEFRRFALGTVRELFDRVMGDVDELIERKLRPASL